MAADNRDFVNKFANEGGGDVLVEDKRMEELKSATAKTGSQISTSAQYIPLQDTDGNLVKINPASFEEAVRNVLGGLLANNDKGSTISGIPALSGSGASLDFGSISPANLASVLGDVYNYRKATITDANMPYNTTTYNIISVYDSIGSSLQNAPTAERFWRLIHISWSSTGIQFYFDNVNLKVFCRSYWGDNYGSWKEI